MSSLPRESMREWMSYLDRETLDRCFLLSRRLCAAASSMSTLRIVDTAHLIVYSTVQNYNVTIAWTKVTRSRRGKPKTEKKSFKINYENAIEAITLFSAALRVCIVKERIEVHMRSLLLRQTDLDHLSETVQELRLKNAKIAVDKVRFGHLDDCHAAEALLSTLDVDTYYFTSSALSVDLLKWADANDMFGGRPGVDWNENAFTEDMILYRCFSGQSTKRFSADLWEPRVSSQFLRRLVQARRDASTRREVRLKIRLRGERPDMEQLTDHAMGRTACTDLYTFEFSDIEDFKLEYWRNTSTLMCTAN